MPTKPSVIALGDLFSQRPNAQSYRTYELKFVDKQPVFVLSEIDRVLDEAIAAAFGEEPELEYCGPTAENELANHK